MLRPVRIWTTLSYMHLLGCKAGVALNPATPLDTIHHCLDKLDLVLVMTVNPGFAARFIDAMLPKVQQAAAMIRGAISSFRSMAVLQPRPHR